MATQKFSEITASSVAFSSNASLVGVSSATADRLFSLSQFVFASTTNISGAIPSSLGGTAVINSSATSLTLAATVAITLTASAAVNVTMPQSGTLLSNSVTNQVISGGAGITATSLSTGSVTVNPGLCQLQYITNGGAFTITASTWDGSMMLLVYNSSSAGAITFANFSVGSNTGDSLTTTSSNKFTISLWRINGTAGYRIMAHQ